MRSRFDRSLLSMLLFVLLIVPSSPVWAKAPEFGLGAYGSDATAKIRIGDSLSAQVGGGVASADIAGSSTRFTALTVLQWSFGGISRGTARPLMAVRASYTANSGNTSGLNVLSLGYGWGFVAPITANSTIGIDMYLITYNSKTAPASSGGNGVSWTFLQPVINGHFYF